MSTTSDPAKLGLEKAIDDLLNSMNSVMPDSKEYSQMADQLIKLYNLKGVDSPKRVSPDVLLTVLGNLFGIVLIVGFEQRNVITSKALGFVLKLK
jgi:hypothetical protein